jgi:pheromone shutdown-related protein TraB
VPVTELASGGTTFHVVGTAHVSQHSVDEVRAVIAERHPEVVCVELDRRRFEALTRGTAFRDLDVLRVVREGRALYALAQIALAAYQRRIGARLGIKPGAELLAAIEAANAAGIPVELIDRDIDITFYRTWRNLGLWTRAVLVISLLVAFRSTSARHGAPVSVEEIENLKHPRALSDMLTELGRAVPELKGPLIDERDQYLASRLTEVGRGRRCVVAVVGAAHVPGIEAQLGTSGDIDRDALDRIPPPSRLSRVIRWLVPIALVAALIRGGAGGLTGLLFAWLVPTSIAAGTCTLAAGGSAASVLSALAAAPLAAVFPPLAISRIVGAIEAGQRRPSLADRERLASDSDTLRGFRHNPVTRTLLVALAASIGTAIGCGIGLVRVIWRL